MKINARNIKLFHYGNLSSEKSRTIFLLLLLHECSYRLFVDTLILGGIAFPLLIKFVKVARRDGLPNTRLTCG
jgi:hypothetical protein